MEEHEWWKDAVVYQIYPRSFQDSNGDGVGDLRGILRRLDYIAELGANVIWLCPIYASPNEDNGYDISDYQKIQPDFGTMEDFECLLREAHKRGIRIILDLVVNHTSDEHRWFAHSRADRGNPRRDYYIWREGRGGGPPNNWNSWFGGSAWQYDAPSGMYYLHIFSPKQPDLNWDNPAVRESVFQMMTWWLDKGVDGFRMDVISLISKPETLPDGPGGDLSPFCINGPHVHAYLREMNERVLSRFDIMTVGECPGVTVEEAKKYAGFNRGELNMVFQFEHTSTTDGPYGKWSDRRVWLPDLKKIFFHWQNGLKGAAWNCLFWGNHDQPRAVSKFGDEREEYRARSAKMLATCLYLMQGTVFLYQGEELGMTNAAFDSLGDYRDIETRNAYRDLVGGGCVTHDEMMRYIHRVSRDNARTPMQWDASPNAGFTTGTPWIGVNPNYKEINAQQEQSDDRSVLSYYKRLLRFRRENAIVRDGDFMPFWPEHDKILGYTRSLNGDTLYVLCNFTDERMPLLEIDTHGRYLETVFCNYEEPGPWALRPFEARVYLVRA
ncbi:alpha-glucosidase [Lawsonibacter hominis]|uniref:glycoside hydrolase family 13 protein n=1 Tax=Lawsonibacter hominis TaxID=2763053 RepID=UPI00332BCE52